MTPDYDQFEADVRARLKVAVPGFKRLEGADDLMSALTSAGNVPACFTLATSVKSDGRLTHNSTAQREEAVLALVVVTESFKSAGASCASNAGLRRLVKIALVGWQPPNARNKFVFHIERFFARSTARVGFEMRFYPIGFMSDYTA